MLQLSGAGKRFGQKLLFEDVNWLITPDERTGLVFSKEDWERKTEEFSGGWQMRIALAKLLLQKPSLLILDEPTNHLDHESRNWLENYLHDYPNAYILISHDRYFLDVTVNKV